MSASTPLLRELVSFDVDARFRNDVQLSHYDDPATNLGLLKCFIFSGTAPNNRQSSIEILKSLKNAITVPNAENRIVCIATYGHGKSHLALALANYFGKPFDTEEMRIVLKKLEDASRSAVEVEPLKQFREHRAPFLVLRLRGDIPAPLHEQVLTQLQMALQDHEATRGERLDFWNKQALDILDRMSQVERAKAEAYLEKQNTELSILRDQISLNQSQAYDQVCALLEHTYGFRPDLGGQISLKDALLKTASKYCDPDRGPLGGILILFDEFSLFIQRHMGNKAAGDLQDLMNGLDALKNRAVFLALAQHDPMATARTYAVNSEQLDLINHELSRIPKKLFLYSLLESVIGAYLHHKNRAEWDRFVRAISAYRARASVAAMSAYTEHYEVTLRWTSEQFDKIVTDGCFPLHPLTTALLSNMEMNNIGGGAPRTVLGFVRKTFEDRIERPVLANDQVNWVLPIELVDYFEDYLPEEPYHQYQAALDRLPENAAPESAKLLKAILLQAAANKKKLRSDEQRNLLAHLAGIPENRVESYLRSLESAGCIFKESGRYAFLPLTANPAKLQAILKKHLADVSLSQGVLTKLTKKYTQGVKVSRVSWGHPDEWAAKEEILTRSLFTPEHLQALFPRYRATLDGIERGVRGGVIWLINEKDEDAAWIRANAAKILDEAFPADPLPLPVVIKTSSRPHPDLVNAILELEALDNFSEAERNEVSLPVYNQAVAQREGVIVNQMVDLRGHSTNFMSVQRKLDHWVVPAPYRANITSVSADSLRVSLDRVLDTCFMLAYPYSPPEFNGIQKSTATSLWTATRTIANSLAENKLAEHVIAGQPMAKDTANNFLYQKWKMVTADYQLRPSSEMHPQIRQAWKVLETAFAPGTRSKFVRDAILQLLNPPYGYDYNTVTLLLCAWFGDHSYELEFTLTNQRVALKHVLELLVTSRSFVPDICGPAKLTISRIDFSQRKSEAQAKIEQARRDTFTMNEAEKLIAELLSYQSEQFLSEDIRNDAAQAAETLQIALQTAQAFDDAAAGLLRTLQSERNVGALLPLHSKIKALPVTGRVTPTCGETTASLSSAWKQAVEERVETTCHQATKFSNLTEVALRQNSLETLKSQLNKANLSGLAKVVSGALSQVKKRADELQAEMEELPKRERINAISTNSPLMTLRESRAFLEEETNGSEELCRLRNTKLENIKSAIRQLETWKNNMLSSVSDLSMLAACKDWQKQYLLKCMWFEGTDEAAQLETAASKVGKLQLVLELYEPLRGSQPANERSLHEIRNKLSNIHSELLTLEAAMAANQINIAKLNLGSYAKEKARIAHVWLQKRQQEFDSGFGLAELPQKLENPPAFLSPEDWATLDMLREAVCKKLDEDVVARIERDFRSIHDPSQQALCLKRLQSLIVEKASQE